MVPSRVAGAVAKGRAREGPALAQASAEGEAPDCIDAQERKGVSTFEIPLIGVTLISGLGDESRDDSFRICCSVLSRLYDI